MKKSKMDEFFTHSLIEEDKIRNTHYKSTEKIHIN